MKKNIPLLKRLRTRFLRMRHRQHFHMDDVIQITECGAAMCIAGHTLNLAGYTYKESDWGGDAKWFTPSGREVKDPLASAQRLLGLTETEAMSLSEENNGKDGLFCRFDIKTPKQAAKVIEKVISQARI